MAAGRRSEKGAASGREGKEVDGGPRSVAPPEVCVHAEPNRRFRESMEDDYSLNEFKIARAGGGEGEGTGGSGGSKGYTRWLCLGVYDGHGGAASARFIAKALPAEVKKRLERGEEVSERFFADVFATVDGRLRREVAHGSSGSTASLVLIRRDGPGEGLLWVANAGDSDVLLSDFGGESRRISAQHKADNPAEARRVEKLGGFVLDGRVGGSLAVSRAFGNFELGKVTRPVPFVDSIAIKAPTEAQIEAKQRRFVVLASDGLWDVMSPDQCANAVRTALRRKKPKDTAAAIVGKAIAAGTMDNTTAIVAFF